MRSIIALIVFLALAPGVQAQDRYFDSAGVQIRYVEKGSGEPVVLIHGGNGDVERTWVDDGAADDLAKNYRVIALDLRGNGKSGKPHDPVAYGAQVSQDVVRLLDHLNISRAHIIGYSYGATITAKLLVTNPERFLTAVLGAASGRRSWNEQTARDAESEAHELETGIPYRIMILRTWPTNQNPPSDQVIRARSRELLVFSDPKAHAARARARVQEVVSDTQLAASSVPTLAIVGSADRNLAGVQELKGAWPALQVVVIENASHWGTVPHQEFVQTIRGFLQARRRL